MIELLALPALACAALVGIHSYFGIHVLRRQIIFVDLALAQVAALGSTAAFLLGHPPQSLAAHGYALIFTLIAAAVLASTRTWSGRITQEAQIGVIYVVSAAAALLLVERAPQGAEHIRQILTGNILTVSWDELRWAIPLYALVGLAYPRIRLTHPWLAEFTFYAAFGLVVTSSVALAGVLLVFAFLIIPAAIGVLHAITFRSQLLVAWAAGTVTAIVGLAISYAGDFSTGATLVCTYGFALAVAAVAQAFRVPHERGAVAAVWLRFARWMIAAVLAASGIWVCIAPRSDQPLLDTVERAFPAVRAAYMDERVRGEELVVRETRGRAREKNRWWIGGVMVLLALSMVISLPSRRTRPRNSGGERRSIEP